MKTLTILCIALAACLLFASPVLASNEHTTFTGNIGTGNPCGGGSVSASGPVDIVVATNTEGDTPNVAIHLSFKAEGTSSTGDAYKMSFIANSTYNAVGSSYIVPYHAVMVGKGKAPNFTIEGNIQVFVNTDNKAIGAWITTLSASCTQ